MIKEVNHVGIKTYRMDDSIHFYEKLLGGKVIRNAGTPDGRFRYVYVQVAAGVVELITSLDENDQGYAHIAFLLADKSLDAHHEAICGYGREFSVPPKPTSSGDGRLAFFADTSGVTFELIERTEDIRLPFVGNGKITTVDGFYVETNVNPADCAPMYKKELGLHGDDAGTRFTLRSDCIALVKAERPRIAYIALRADDPDALRAELKAAGIATEAAKHGEGAFWITAPAGECHLVL